MNKDCNVNMKELTNIVDGMLAEKNNVGRQVFEDMTNEVKLPADLGRISSSMQSFLNDLSNFATNSKSDEEISKLKDMLFYEIGGSEAASDETSQLAKVVVDALFKLYGM